MSTLMDIGGTLRDTFRINGVSIRAGDNEPSNDFGFNGDIYLQRNGRLWQKANNNWAELAGEGSGLPRPDGHAGDFLRLAEDGSAVEYYSDSDKVLQAHIDNTVDANYTVNGEWTFTNVIQGTAYRAQWGDVAEYYNSDVKYPKGTLVKFGGEQEITIADDVVNAVITSEPGIILNASGVQCCDVKQPIALVGRVPIRIKGKVNKFDHICLSDENGVGISYNESLDTPANFYNKTIGIALEDKETDEEGLVLCVTKLDF